MSRNCATVRRDTDSFERPKLSARCGSSRKHDERRRNEHRPARNRHRREQHPALDRASWSSGLRGRRSSLVPICPCPGSRCARAAPSSTLRGVPMPYTAINFMAHIISSSRRRNRRRREDERASERDPTFAASSCIREEPFRYLSRSYPPALCARCLFLAFHELGTPPKFHPENAFMLTPSTEPVSVRQRYFRGARHTTRDRAGTLFSLFLCSRPRSPFDAVLPTSRALLRAS